MKKRAYVIILMIIFLLAGVILYLTQSVPHVVRNFLTVHYSMTLQEANALKHNPENFEALINERYSNTPANQACLDKIIMNGMTSRLIIMAVDAQEDVTVSALDIELTGNHDGRKSYAYTVTLKAGTMEKNIKGQLSVNTKPKVSIGYIREIN